MADPPVQISNYPAVGGVALTGKDEAKELQLL